MNAEGKNGYVLLNVKTQEIFESRDVRFMKETKPTPLEGGAIQMINTLFGSEVSESEPETLDPTVQDDPSEQNVSNEQDELNVQDEQNEPVIQNQSVEDNTNEVVHVHEPEIEPVVNVAIDTPSGVVATERADPEKGNIIFLTDTQYQTFTMTHPESYIKEVQRADALYFNFVLQQLHSASYTDFSIKILRIESAIFLSVFHL